MLREGHWASPAPQSADPAGGSILHDPDQPGAGKSDHRHDPTRDHLGRSVFPDRRGGDHTGEPPHRARLRRRRSGRCRSGGDARGLDGVCCRRGGDECRAAGTGACLPRPCEPAGRQLGARRAAGRHSLVHTGSRTGVQHCDRNQRSGTASRSRQRPDSPGQSGRTLDRAEAAGAGDLPGQLARRLGRYPSDRRHFHVRNQAVDLGMGEIVAEVLIVSRLLQFAAVILVFGCGAFRLYGLGGDTATTFAGVLTIFDAWFWRVTIAGAIVVLLSALSLMLATTANMAGSGAAALDPDTISKVMLGTSFGRVWRWHLFFAFLLIGACPVPRVSWRMPAILVLSLLLLLSL